MIAVIALPLGLICCDEAGLRIADPSPPSDAGAEWGSGESGVDEGTLPGLEDEGNADNADTSDAGTGSSEDGGDGGGDGLQVFIPPSANWRYELGPDASPGWSDPVFDDLAWAEGPAPFGQGFETPTVIPVGPVRLRASFEVTDPSAVTGLLLRLRRDDGAIAWLNGTEVVRSNMPEGALGPGAFAASEAIGHDAYQYYRAFPDPALLQAGDNVLAVALHPHGPGDSDLAFDALLRGIDPDLPPDDASFQIRTRTYAGKYGPRQVGAIWIEDTQGFVRTLEVWGGTRREHLVAWRNASADNVVDALTSATRPTHGTHLATWDLLRADGTPASPGAYQIRVEFTEANSNNNAAPGPQLSLAFELGAGPTTTTTPTSGDPDRFTDLLLYTP